MQHATIAGDQEGPEIETAMALEGEKNLDIEFDNIVPRHGREGANGHVNGNVERDLFTVDAIV